MQLVEKDRVPGSQIVAMSLSEFIQDLGMSRLQAKRLDMNRIQ